jgi:hypothetical protein
MTPQVDPRLLLLSPADNVFVVRSRLRAGDEIMIGPARVALPKDIPLGHKIAARAISPGDKVLKYGAPIGSAVAQIAPGEHVHVHNMKSDYTPTHHLYEAKARHGESA